MQLFNCLIKACAVCKKQLYYVQLKYFRERERDMNIVEKGRCVALNTSYKVLPKGKVRATGKEFGTIIVIDGFVVVSMLTQDMEVVTGFFERRLSEFGVDCYAFDSEKGTISLNKSKFY